MNDKTKVTSGDGQASGAQVEGDKTAEQVSYETYSRVLDEAKKAKEQLKEARSHLSDYERKAKEVEDKKLAEEGNFKLLLEQREKEVTEYRSKYEGLNLSLQNSIKKQAVLRKIGGELKHPDYARFINVDAVAFADMESMQIDEGSVNLVANDFLKEHASLIKRATGGIPPGDAPKNTGSQAISYDEWLKITDLKEKKARMKDVQKK